MIVGGFQGGGVDFPSTPSAGDTPIYAKQGIGNPTSAGTYTYLGVGWGFTTQKAAALRILYSAACRQGYISGLKLRKNGVDITDSLITGSSYYISKSIDITVATGDRVELWGMYELKGEFAGVCAVQKFEVFISAPEVQAAINDILTPTVT